LNQLDFSPFMHGSEQEPFTCIFAECALENPAELFRDPGRLLWHIYHSHGLNVEPVGKPKHPRFWEEILYTGKDQLWKLGWDEKKQLVDEILTKSVSWEYSHIRERIIAE
jgi:hypothetical protein